MATMLRLYDFNPRTREWTEELDETYALTLRVTRDGSTAAELTSRGGFIRTSFAVTSPLRALPGPHRAHSFAARIVSRDHTVTIDAVRSVLGPVVRFASRFTCSRRAGDDDSLASDEQRFGATEYHALVTRVESTAVRWYDASAAMRRIMLRMRDRDDFGAEGGQSTIPRAVFYAEVGAALARLDAEDARRAASSPSPPPPQRCSVHALRGVSPELVEEWGVGVDRNCALVASRRAAADAAALASLLEHGGVETFGDAVRAQRATFLRSLALLRVDRVCGGVAPALRRGVIEALNHHVVGRVILAFSAQRRTLGPRRLLWGGGAGGDGASIAMPRQLCMAPARPACDHVASGAALRQLRDVEGGEWCCATGFAVVPINGVVDEIVLESIAARHGGAAGAVAVEWRPPTRAFDGALVDETQLVQPRGVYSLGCRTQTRADFVQWVEVGAYRETLPDLESEEEEALEELGVLLHCDAMRSPPRFLVVSGVAAGTIGSLDTSTTRVCLKENAAALEDNDDASFVKLVFDLGYRHARQQAGGGGGGGSGCGTYAPAQLVAVGEVREREELTPRCCAEVAAAWRPLDLTQRPLAGGAVVGSLRVAAVDGLRRFTVRGRSPLEAQRVMSRVALTASVASLSGRWIMVDADNGTLFTYALDFAPCGDAEVAATAGRRIANVVGKQDELYNVTGFVEDGVLSWSCLVPNQSVVRCAGTLLPGGRVVAGVYTDVTRGEVIGRFEGRRVEGGGAG